MVWIFVVDFLIFTSPIPWCDGLAVCEWSFNYIMYLRFDQLNNEVTSARSSDFSFNKRSAPFKQLMVVLSNIEFPFRT